MMKIKSLGKLAATAAVILSSSTAFAFMDRDAAVTELESQMEQVRTETAMGTFGAQTASARPEVDGHGWFVTVDVLKWKIKLGGTEFAYTDFKPVGGLPIKGRAKNVDFDWDWGLRAGLGYNFEHDGWDLKAEYTYIDINGSESVSAGLNSSVIPLKGSSDIVEPNVFTFCDKAKTQFDFDYQTVDLELGRDYYVSSELSLRPFWGLKSAWIDMDQNTRYTGGTPGVTEDLGLELDTVKVQDSSRFWGLGPRTGVNTRWYLGEGFSLFGNASIAALFGHFNVSQRESYSANPAMNRIRLSADRHAFSPTGQLQLGLRWDGYFDNNRKHFGIGLGYEGQYWWRINQMIKIDDSSVLKYERYSEDLSMYGVTLDLKLDF